MLPLIKKTIKKIQKTKPLPHNSCKQEFSDMFNKDENYPKIRDYIHYTGKLKGAVHSICNLRYKTLGTKSMWFFITVLIMTITS